MISGDCPTAASAAPDAEGSVNAHLATVTVTYAPELDVLGRQIAQLPRAARRIIVDNGSSSEHVAALRTLAGESGAVLIANATNLGLAAALDVGIGDALAAGCDLVLLLDQDTEPGPGDVDALVAARAGLVPQFGQFVCVGPRLVDPATGLEHGFHRIQGLRWTRARGAGALPVECASLNGSGTLAPATLLRCVGGPEAALFIDHVDTEWSFRAIAGGGRLVGIPSVSFVHRMGDRTWRFWLGSWHVWPYRPPRRHYYLFRNATTLLRRPYVPFVWKVWVLPKLVLTAVVHGMFDGARRGQLAAMWRGACDGWHASVRKPG